jgi:hypothetical protein
MLYKIPSGKIMKIREGLYSDNEAVNVLKGMLNPLISGKQPEAYIPLDNGIGLLINQLPNITIIGGNKNVREDVRQRLETSLNIKLEVA